MGTSGPSIDPNHEAKRAILSRVGGGMLVVGVLGLLVGFGLFFSVFFARDLPSAFPRAVVGLMLAGAGGFAAVAGAWAFGVGNFGRVLRYQAGEMVPVYKDMARDVAPVSNEMTRGIARSAREGWEEGVVPRPTGHLLACPSCGAPNATDARFCNQCGAHVEGSS